MFDVRVTCVCKLIQPACLLCSSELLQDGAERAADVRAAARPPLPRAPRRDEQQHERAGPARAARATAARDRGAREEPVQIKRRRSLCCLTAHLLTGHVLTTSLLRIVVATKISTFMFFIV